MRSPGRQWCTGTVPRWHGRSVSRRRSCPGSTAPKVVTRTSWRAPFLSPAAGRFWLLVIGDSSDLLAASTGSVLQVSSVSASASLRGRLGRRLILRYLQRLHRRRIPALPCTGSPEAGETSGPSFRVPHLLAEQYVLVAVLRVQLEPPSVVHSRGRAGISAGKLPWTSTQRCAGTVWLERPSASLKACWCADV